MDANVARTLLHNPNDQLALVAQGKLSEGLTQAGYPPASLIPVWILQPTGDPNLNGNLFFQAMFGMPEGIQATSQSFGSRECDLSGDTVPFVVLQARAEAATEAAVSQLQNLGFAPFLEFVYSNELAKKHKSLERDSFT